MSKFGHHQTGEPLAGSADQATENWRGLRNLSKKSIRRSRFKSLSSNLIGTTGTDQFDFQGSQFGL
jgi:hypothetical protein